MCMPPKGLPKLVPGKLHCCSNDSFPGPLGNLSSCRATKECSTPEWTKGRADGLGRTPHGNRREFFRGKEEKEGWEAGGAREERSVRHSRCARERARERGSEGDPDSDSSSD